MKGKPRVGEKKSLSLWITGLKQVVPYSMSDGLWFVLWLMLNIIFSSLFFENSPQIEEGTYP